MLNHIISVREAAELWDLSSETVTTFCATGNVLAKKIDETWVIYRNQRKPHSQNQDYVNELDAEIKWDLTPRWEQREILDRNSRIIDGRLEMLRELKEAGVDEAVIRTKVFVEMTDEEFDYLMNYYHKHQA